MQPRKQCHQCTCHEQDDCGIYQIAKTYQWSCQSAEQESYGSEKGGGNAFVFPFRIESQRIAYGYQHATGENHKEQRNLEHDERPFGKQRKRS